MTRRTRGMTLLELLVVIVLLTAVAGAAVSTADTFERRGRHDETVARLAAVREAVLGPDVVTPNGLLSGGYVQDVGWLPAAAADLVIRPSSIPIRSYDTTWRTWAGWAGPYLVPPPLRAGETVPVPYDGWGRDFTGFPGGTPWTVPLHGGPLPVRSLGADGVAETGSETDALDRDWPAASQPLLAESDWAIDVGAWQVVLVNLRTDGSGTPVSTTLTGARLRVVVPRWDRADPLGHWPASPAERDAWEHYGGAAFNVTIPAGGTAALGAFGAGSVRRVPAGRRSIVLVDDATGSPTVPEGSGATVTGFAEIELSRRLSPRTIRIEVR